jgi:hypothetical protein
LAKIGAWKKENKNSIPNNISRMEKSLNLPPATLTKNDFWKVEGSFMNQKSLEESLLLMSHQPMHE